MVEPFLNNSRALVKGILTLCYNYSFLFWLMSKCSRVFKLFVEWFM